MLHPAIYRTIFNLDKDRKDLPAGNPAVPYQTAPLAGGESDGDVPPPPVNIKPYQPVPKPPGMTKPKEEVAVTAEERIDPTNDTATETETVAVAPLTSSEVQNQALPRGVAQDEEWRRRREAEFAELSQIDWSATGDNAPTPEQRKRWLDLQTAGAGSKKQANERNAFFGEAEASPSTAPQKSMAEREAEIQKQAVLALASPVSRPEADAVPENWGTAKQMKRAKGEYEYGQKLKAALPYENPQTEAERRENRVAELKFKAENPRNEDRGVKGFIRETLQNFFHGLSKAQGVPGISIGQALMLGGVGVGGGMLNRGWNEQRAAEEALPGAQKDLEFQLGQDKSRRALDLQDASIGIREGQLQRQKEKDLLDADYRREALKVKTEDRAEYLQLLRDRDLYKAAGDKKKIALAEQRLEALRERNKVLKEQGDRKLDQVDAKQGISTGSKTPRPQSPMQVLKAAEAQLAAQINAGASPEYIEQARKRIKDYKIQNNLK